MERGLPYTLSKYRSKSNTFNRGLCVTGYVCLMLLLLLLVTIVILHFVVDSNCCDKETINSEENQQFPAVTVCNNNPVKESAAYPYLQVLFNEWRAERFRRDEALKQAATVCEPNEIFHLTQDIVVDEMNKKTIRDITLVECLNQCLLHNWCKSIDYRPDIVCHLSPYSLNDPGVALKLNHGFYFAHRCHFSAVTETVANAVRDMLNDKNALVESTLEPTKSTSTDEPSTETTQPLVDNDLQEQITKFDTNGTQDLTKEFSGNIIAASTTEPYNTPMQEEMKELTNATAQDSASEFTVVQGLRNNLTSTIGLKKTVSNTSPPTDRVENREKTVTKPNDVTKPDNVQRGRVITETKTRHEPTAESTSEVTVATEDFPSTRVPIRQFDYSGKTMQQENTSHKIKQLVEALGRLNDGTMNNITYSVEGLLSQCRYNGEMCSLTYDFFDPRYGRCNTFEMPPTVEGTNKEGLVLTLINDVSQYPKDLELQPGFVLSVSHKACPSCVMEFSNKHFIPDSRSSMLGLQQVETEKTYSCLEGQESSFLQQCKQYCVRQTVYKRCQCVDPWLLTPHIEQDILSDASALLCDPDNPEQEECREKQYNLSSSCVEQCMEPCKTITYEERLQTTNYIGRYVPSTSEFSNGTNQTITEVQVYFDSWQVKKITLRNCNKIVEKVLGICALGVLIATVLIFRYAQRSYVLKEQTMLSMAGHPSSKPKLNEGGLCQAPRTTDRGNMQGKRSEHAFKEIEFNEPETLKEIIIEPLHTDEVESRKALLSHTVVSPPAVSQAPASQAPTSQVPTSHTCALHAPDSVTTVSHVPKSEATGYTSIAPKSIHEVDPGNSKGHADNISKASVCEVEIVPSNVIYPHCNPLSIRAPEKPVISDQVSQGKLADSELTPAVKSAGSEQFAVPMPVDSDQSTPTNQVACGQPAQQSGTSDQPKPSQPAVSSNQHSTFQFLAASQSVPSKQSLAANQHKNFEQLQASSKPKSSKQTSQPTPAQSSIISSLFRSLLTDLNSSKSPLSLNRPAALDHQLETFKVPAPSKQSVDEPTSQSETDQPNPIKETSVDVDSGTPLEYEKDANLYAASKQSEDINHSAATQESEDVNPTELIKESILSSLVSPLLRSVMLPSKSSKPSVSSSQATACNQSAVSKTPVKPVSESGSFKDSDGVAEARPVKGLDDIDPITPFQLARVEDQTATFQKLENVVQQQKPHQQSGTALHMPPTESDFDESLQYSVTDFAQPISLSETDVDGVVPSNQTEVDQPVSSFRAVKDQPVATRETVMDQPMATSETDTDPPMASNETDARSASAETAVHSVQHVPPQTSPPRPLELITSLSYVSSIQPVLVHESTVSGQNMLPKLSAPSAQDMPSKSSAPSDDHLRVSSQPSGQSTPIQPLESETQCVSVHALNPLDSPVSPQTPEPLDQPVSVQTSEVGDQPVSSQTSEPVDQPMSAQTSRPLGHPVSAQTSKPVDQSVSGPMSKPSDKPVSARSARAAKRASSQLSGTSKPVSAQPSVASQLVPAQSCMTSKPASTQSSGTSKTLVSAEHVETSKLPAPAQSSGTFTPQLSAQTNESGNLPVSAQSSGVSSLGEEPSQRTLYLSCESRDYHNPYTTPHEEDPVTGVQAAASERGLASGGNDSSQSPRTVLRPETNIPLQQHIQKKQPSSPSRK